MTETTVLGVHSEVGRLRQAILHQAALHRIEESGVIWDGADRKGATGTDPELAQAEDFKPRAPG